MNDSQIKFIMFCSKFQRDREKGRRPRWCYCFNEMAHCGVTSWIEIVFTVRLFSQRNYHRFTSLSSTNHKLIIQTPFFALAFVVYGVTPTVCRSLASRNRNLFVCRICYRLLVYIWFHILGNNDAMMNLNLSMKIKKNKIYDNDLLTQSV